MYIIHCALLYTTALVKSTQTQTHTHDVYIQLAYCCQQWVILPTHFVHNVVVSGMQL